MGAAATDNNPQTKVSALSTPPASQSKPTKKPKKDLLHFTCANFFRQRLVLATLAGRSMKITEIRSNDENPGLRDYEASFLRLLDKLTDGGKIIINETGTQLRYDPGQLIGAIEGKAVVHDCPVSRGITYFTQALILLLPFSRNPVKLHLKGVTNDGTDISIDTFRTVSLPLLKHFGIEGEKLTCKVVKRSCGPAGGGEVHFSCPILKSVRPVNLMDEGRWKRVRGVAYTLGMTPQFATRAVDAARGVLNNFIPDVWIFTDHIKSDGNSSATGKGSGKGGNNSGGKGGNSSGADGEAEKPTTSPGFGMSLVAESTKNCFKSADSYGMTEETLYNGKKVMNPMEPEEVGKMAAKRLLSEIQYDGVVDTSHQIQMLHYCALSEEDQASRVRLGMLTAETKQYLRDVKEIFGVKFRVKDETNEDGVEEYTGEEKSSKGSKGSKSGKRKRSECDSDGEEERESENSDSEEESSAETGGSEEGGDKEEGEEEKKVIRVPHEDGTGSVVLSCVGIGFKNISRPTF